MDFFATQDRSHRNTRIAIALFVVAVLIIVTAVCFIVATVDYNLDPAVRVFGWPTPHWFELHWRQVVVVAAITTGLIVAGSLYQAHVLGKGGGHVARSLGGKEVNPETTDLDERKLINIVTEMSIASGVPMPEIYVLPDKGINAFAAGFTPANAAVGVTRGCIVQLNRDELQGVIAHEFSHILNGDMRLNIRLMGVLHGILLIAIAGQMLLRMAAWGSYGRSYSRSRRGGGGGGLMAAGVGVGAALMAVGYIGVLFSRIIQSVISRQREYLADASAVQFTRNPDGISGALKKIAGIVEGSRIDAPQVQEVSHMLFGAYRQAWLQLFATHPPLEKRIRALDPAFRPEHMPVPQVGESAQTAAAGVSAMAGAAVPGHTAAQVGQPQAGHLQYAHALLEKLPADLIEATHDVDRAEALVLAVVIHPEPDVRQAQVAALKQNLDAPLIRLAAQYYQTLRGLGREVYLPLLDLCMPALHRGGADRARHLVDLIHELAWADGTMSTFEFATIAVLRAHLRDAFEAPTRRPGRAGLGTRREDVRDVFTLLARTGGESERSAGRAYAAGMMDLYGSSWPEMPEQSIADIAGLERALDGLDTLSNNAKRQLVGALANVVGHDDRVTQNEYELLRAVCETIHCPLPPLIA